MKPVIIDPTYWVTGQDRKIHELEQAGYIVLFSSSSDNGIKVCKPELSHEEKIECIIEILIDENWALTEAYEVNEGRHRVAEKIIKAINA